MNIFYLHPDPLTAPRYMYDRHVVKMILESAQMLCTAHHECGSGLREIPYKPTHKNHPSAVWARSSGSQYLWLYQHFVGLCHEYTRRYGKIHASDIKCTEVLRAFPSGLTVGDFSAPPQCMPDEYKCESSLEAYWRYYINAKSHLATSREQAICQQWTTSRGTYIEPDWAEFIAHTFFE